MSSAENQLTSASWLNSRSTMLVH